MTTLDTHPYRVKLVRYANLHGLADEDHFDPRLHGPLGKPGRLFTARLQRHMMARKKREDAAAPDGRRLYPHVKENGTLDEPTRAVLDHEFPDRPTFEAAFLQIARLDDVRDGEEYYTQGPGRWRGVDDILGHLRVGVPPALTSGDCSAGYTRWILWGLQQHLGRTPNDIVNGTHWTGGFTGTIAAVCQRVETPMIGDAILYGRSPYTHCTAVVDVAKRLCVSHGRAKAEIVDWDRHRARASGFWRPRYARV